jgi:MerR family transcriptional regulator, copper efflux regulator
MAAPRDTLTIGRLARIGGVNLETIRYYERSGLLPKPPRTASGYRMFPDDAPGRLQFINRAQELGFSLAEIRDLFSLRLRKGATRAEIRTRADAKLADIDQKIESLRAMKKTLLLLRNRCEGCGSLTECPILQSLDAMPDAKAR